MLVIVEDGDVTHLLQAALNLKAPGSGNVLQVDAAEGTGDIVHGLDKLVHVLGLDTKRESIHIGKALEEHALALHDRHTGLRTDVAQAQHGRAVGDDGHQVVAAGQLVALIRVLLDGQAGLGHAGGVGQGQLLLVAGGHSGHYLDLTLPLPMQTQGLLRVIHKQFLSFYQVNKRFVLFPCPLFGTSYASLYHPPAPVRNQKAPPVSRRRFDS